MHNYPITRFCVLVGLVSAYMAMVVLFLAQPPAVLPQSASPSSNSAQTGAGQVRSAPAANSQNLIVTVPEDFATLKLAPGFLLNVQVYDEPDFSGHIRVDGDGNIKIPFLKTLHVTGDTAAQTRDGIRQLFRDEGILTNPQITVDVEQFATTSATVLGEVQNPGKIELLTPHSLLDVIGLTGGETPLAGDQVELTHAVSSSLKETSSYRYSRGSNGDSIRGVMVRPGDTVIVKRAGIVYVLGAVNRPGGYAMQEEGELNVAQAISMAQGLAMQAKTSALRVVTHGPDGRLINTPVSYNRMMDGKDVPMTLAAGDIVYVPVSKLKTVFTTSSSLIGQTAAASIYKVQ